MNLHKPTAIFILAKLLALNVDKQYDTVKSSDLCKLVDDITKLLPKDNYVRLLKEEMKQ